MEVNPLKFILRSIRQEAIRKNFGWQGVIALMADKYIASRRQRTPIGKPEFSMTNKVLLGLKKTGYYIIPNFISNDECKILSSLLQEALTEHPSVIHPATSYDLRLHGIENLDARFRFFSDHPLLQEIACRYLEEPAKVAFTLAASLKAEPGNPGSGGGWHRDSFVRQFKAMLYLTDVTKENGPFQLLSRSHHLYRVILDNLIVRRPYGDSRISEAEIDQILSKTSRDRLKTLTGKAGTLVIFDSTTIHRGAPIVAGNRLALTNYFFPEHQINSELYQHFRPVAGIVA